MTVGLLVTTLLFFWIGLDLGFELIRHGMHSRKCVWSLRLLVRDNACDVYRNAAV
jgi:hypothetical protein